MSVVPFRTAAEVASAVPCAVDHLGAGGLIAYPTETVYGLGCLPVDSAVAELAALKGRALGKPFLLLVSSTEMAEGRGLMFTQAARALARRHWPGPLTLVLSGGRGKLPDSLRGSEGGIAVRWTSHPGALALIDAMGEPITSTSANRPGGPTAPGVGAILNTFGSAVARGALLVLDAGVLGNVPPSTIVDCTAAVPRLIRDGAVPWRELRTIVETAIP
jgi:L-threonylcarbamoyladenylate synthase